MSNVISRGQLPASSGTILAASPGSGLFTLFLCNTSSSLTETITVTNVGVDGVTTHLMSAQTLAPNSTYVLQGIPTIAGDVLKGSTTDASTVDYQVTSIEGSFTLASYNSTGAKQGVSSGITAGQTISGRMLAQLLASGPPPVDTYAASMTIDVTYSLHVVLGSNGTSAACTMTPSGHGNAGDELTIITEADGTGTVTVTFASTFHAATTQATTLSHFSVITFVSDGTVWLEKSRITALA